MSMDKGIEHGKEKRAPYYKSGKHSRGCRPGGSCAYCQRNRQHKHVKAAKAADEQAKEN